MGDMGFIQNGDDLWISTTADFAEGIMNSALSLRIIIWVETTRSSGW
jgi:hypothetical protein